ncbi:MAG: cobalt-precorrin-5B (C(1))-methyltransferase CbiD [Proteobacteria bacterium]|nr:cobalt-precorrin-5B (C(1))-methyltransferase CbiD [Pseudomonadota bacterium]
MAQKKLKSGFTTGTAAAAAVKGALLFLVNRRKPESVRIPFLSEGFVDIPIHRCEKKSNDQAVCAVIKDAGDDPDVTHKAEIGAVVTMDSSLETIRIRGGKGVGRVTKKGLGLELDGPAINSGPVRMIHQAVSDILGQGSHGLDIEIFVPQGEILALKTLNARLGIMGGISILGTTGIVRPMSHDAYIATITSSLSVAASAGLTEAVFTTGRRSERFAMQLFPAIPPEGFIQIGDFFQTSLESAMKQGLSRITLSVFFGKAVKMAQGVGHTHAAKSELSLQTLGLWALEISGDKALEEKIITANTARHAFDFIIIECPDLIKKVGHEMIRSAKKFAGQGADIRSVIFDFEGNVVFDSKKGEVTQ